MAKNDGHILRLIGNGKLKQLFIAIYGDPESDGNLLISRKAGNLQASRPAREPLEVQYFDAATARVWG